MDNSLQYNNQRAVDDKQRRRKYKNGTGAGEENVEGSKSRGNSVDEFQTGDDGLVPRSVMEDPHDDGSHGGEQAQDQYKHHKINRNNNKTTRTNELKECKR